MKISEQRIRRLSDRLKEAADGIEAVNDDFLFGGVGEADLEGPKPEYVTEEAWNLFQTQVQRLKIESNSFFHYCGLKVVIERRG